MLKPKKSKKAQKEGESAKAIFQYYCLCIYAKSLDKKCQYKILAKLECDNKLALVHT